LTEGMIVVRQPGGDLQTRLHHKRSYDVGGGFDAVSDICIAGVDWQALHFVRGAVVGDGRSIVRPGIRNIHCMSRVTSRNGMKTSLS
jgi:hypothetical protein